MDELIRENQRLQAEIDRLLALLCSHGIEALSPDPVPGSEGINTPEHSADTASSDPLCITKQSAAEEKVVLFRTMFMGREDVYARRWKSKEGKTGYSPVCANEWKRGICPKPKVKCAKCAYADYLPYDDLAVTKHLRGECVLGIYPLREDNTCHFLAIDFDEDDWRAEVLAAANVCKEKDVPYAIEISRSGNGAHLWFFFADPLPASQARAFGSVLLSDAMNSHARLSFSSYDRMFPNQDTLPKGGFGNLIALPFQKEAYRNGGSVFVNEALEPFGDQWIFLSAVQKITSSQMEQWLTQWKAPPLGELREDDTEESKPWHKKEQTLSTADVPTMAKCVVADRLYLPVEGFSQGAQNHIKRLAAFKNPAFYKAQAMRMPVWNIPRVICCAEYLGEYLCLPRGCRDDVIGFADANSINMVWEDLCCCGMPIHARFRGELREEQQMALHSLCSHDEGVLSAATAFGKTVVGAAMIAEKRVNTLILVHRKQLMKQWQERLQTFLQIDNPLPEEPKRKGRRKKREVIGLFGAGKDTRSGIVDIAILQSMGKPDDIKPWIADYGMVIVDECHHVPAVSFEQVLKATKAKYRYGLTATPTRQDGHHPILNMYLGKIRYCADAKAQAEKRPFAHVMIPRFTGSRFALDPDSTSAPIVQYYSEITQDDLRNHQIVDDVLACVSKGRNCLLLSERKQHVCLLAELLRESIHDVLILTGGKTNAETEKQFAQLRAIPDGQPLVICATGKYIGEGFDESRLDTLFLTMPISWQGTLAQYAGRLHRFHEGKREVRIYDYIDADAEMLERMYHKRLRGYAAIGYHVAVDENTTAVSSDIIYDQDTFQERFLYDLQNAKRTVLIVSPYITVRRIHWLEPVLNHLMDRQVSVTIQTRPPEAFQGRAAVTAQEAIAILKTKGVTVHCLDHIHQKYAVMDDTIVWYGSINLLSFGKSQESIMRLVSSSVARALKRKGGNDSQQHTMNDGMP